MVSVPKQLLFQALLIACNAFFASMEIAVISLNTTKLRKLADEVEIKDKNLIKLFNREEIKLYPVSGEKGLYTL